MLMKNRFVDFKILNSLISKINEIPQIHNFFKLYAFSSYCSEPHTPPPFPLFTIGECQKDVDIEQISLKMITMSS